MIRAIDPVPFVKELGRGASNIERTARHFVNSPSAPGGFGVDYGASIAPRRRIASFCSSLLVGPCGNSGRTSDRLWSQANGAW